MKRYDIDVNWQEHHILETEKPKASFPIFNWNCIQVDKKKYSSKKKKKKIPNPKPPQKTQKPPRTDEQKAKEGEGENSKTLDLWSLPYNLGFSELEVNENLLSIFYFSLIAITFLFSHEV